ncbi:MAG: hypothetical protein ACOYL9_00860 [Ilumatobacteraceae bacterium]
MTLAWSPERTRVVGAATAQFSQALGSVLLQILAARLLGSSGLATFAVLYGIIVVATAIVSGFVGDSLTVLDRWDPRVRAGLQRCFGVLCGAVGVGSAVAVLLWSNVSTGSAVVFGLATLVFVFEDMPRRMLMACMRFWSIVAVDLVSLAGSIGFIALAHASGTSVNVTTFLWALVIGQVAASVAAILLLPADERWWARADAGSWRTVWSYGRWRALQQSMRPIMLVVVRMIAVAFVGVAAYGEVEAARVFVAPAVLASSGASSYLFSVFARERQASVRSLLRLADIGAASLVVFTVALVGTCLVLEPWLGSVIDGGNFTIDTVAIVGWATYSVGIAITTPYGMLAAVRARQSLTFLMRVVEAIACCVGVWVILSLGWSVVWMPMVLAVPVMLTGVALRIQLVRGRDVTLGAAPTPIDAMSER